MLNHNAIAIPRSRIMAGATGLVAAMAGIAATITADKTPDIPATARTEGSNHAGNYVTTKDGTQIFYKDWGTGTPVVFSHGWPLNSDSWEDQMFFLASHGYRVIAHDRRGHGRSSQPWQGNDMDTYADDLATLIEKLDLKGAVLIGHSTGGGEITHYVGRHGTKRVSKMVLADAVPPLLMKTPSNPNGIPIEVWDSFRGGIQADRAKFCKQFGVLFYGTNRPGSKVSEEVVQTLWQQCMATSLPAAYLCIKALSETDFTEDLKRVNVPMLIVHGDDDQIVPLDNGKRTAALVKGSILKVYPGAPHGLPVTHKDQFNADLLAFIKG